MDTCAACLNLARKDGVDLGATVATRRGDVAVVAVTHGLDRATPYLVLVRSDALGASWLVRRQELAVLLAEPPFSLPTQAPPEMPGPEPRAPREAAAEAAAADGLFDPADLLEGLESEGA